MVGRRGGAGGGVLLAGLFRMGGGETDVGCDRRGLWWGERPVTGEREKDELLETKGTCPVGVPGGSLLIQGCQGEWFYSISSCLFHFASSALFYHK